MTFYEDIIEQLVSGEIASKDEIHLAKIRLCKKYKLDRIPSDADILEHAGEDIYEDIEPFLRLKPVRTSSGVAVVAVMTSPEDCPHGKCLCCPGGKKKNTAQSYTGREPAAMRASQNDFDPYRQTKSRVQQLRQIGHPTDKIDLIIMGGTFTARTQEYQEWFVKRCLDALNEKEADSLLEAQSLNELAPSRCIGMTLETRPDWSRKVHVNSMLELGATRVELGVQTLYDDVLMGIERGHTVSDSIKATRFLKDSGMKVCYHMMPGLPGSDMTRDLDMFRSLFEDPRFRPDMLKIYPTLVVEGTGLYENWKNGQYKPYNTDECADLIAKIKTFIPSWVRIQRIQRDIPVQLISDGVKKSNLREIVQMKMKESEKECRCIRCREVGISSIKGKPADPDSIALKTLNYEASGGKEHFLSFEDKNGIIIAYARLREPSRMAQRAEVIQSPCTLIRELKVSGEMVPIGQVDDAVWQHKGFGQALLEECAAISGDCGAKRMLVTSGIGAREYYRKLGYDRVGPYMGKEIR